jgi:hypothetical protein
LMTRWRLMQSRFVAMYWYCTGFLIRHPPSAIPHPVATTLRSGGPSAERRPLAFTIHAACRLVTADSCGRRPRPCDRHSGCDLSFSGSSCQRLPPSLFTRNAVWVPRSSVRTHSRCSTVHRPPRSAKERRRQPRAKGEPPPAPRIHFSGHAMPVASLPHGRDLASGRSSQQPTGGVVWFRELSEGPSKIASG